MNPIRLLRMTAGVTQQDLAMRAGTSQPTIASYESGAKSPAWSTVQRLALSLDLEVSVTFVPPMTREDHRSLAYHRAVAKILKKKPTSTIERAKRNIRNMIALHSGARELLNQWRSWLDLPIAELISRLLGPELMARDMRQVSPFAGLLGPKERAQVLREFRKEFVR